MTKRWQHCPIHTLKHKQRWILNTSGFVLDPAFPRRLIPVHFLESFWQPNSKAFGKVPMIFVIFLESVSGAINQLNHKKIIRKVVKNHQLWSSPTVQIRKFAIFLMRPFETRLCSSKNALFQKMIKPKISPKDRTEFQEKIIISIFFRVGKLPKWRDRRFKKQWFSKTENVDYACRERLKTKKKHENDHSLNRRSLHFGSLTNWVKNLKTWILLVGKGLKTKKTRKYSKKSQKSQKSVRSLNVARPSIFRGGRLPIAIIWAASILNLVFGVTL